MTNYDKFVAVLTSQYTNLFENDSAYHKVKQRMTPEGLATTMTHGLVKGKSDIKGQGVKATCKALGIKNTYKAINEYLTQTGD